MNNRRLGVIASIVLAVLGTALLVFYVRGAHSDATGKDEAVDVVVAAEPIAKGTTAEDMVGKLRVEEVPASLKVQGALTRVQGLAGRAATVDLLPGEQVTESRLAPVADVQRGEAPPGSLQVTVPIEGARALGNDVKAGDLIGVVASFDDPKTTHLLLEKAYVAKVESSSGGAPAPTGTLFVTFALDPPSVEKLVFAAEFGRLWFSSQPADAANGPTPVQDMGTVNL